MILEIPELNDMAEKALSRSMPNAVATRGVIVVEFLPADSEHRGVLAAQFGRQGMMQPWEIMALLDVVQIDLEDAIKQMRHHPPGGTEE